MNSVLRFGSVLASLAVTVNVFADSIAPSSFSDTIPAVGGTTTVHKTVTVDAGRPVSSKVDVFFLADTTGSMGGQIAAVRAGAASILSGAAGLGDVAFAVGEYKDFGDVYVYRENTDITTVQATAQAGINLWAAGGGGDFPEANLFALSELSSQTQWRAGSERILVWFGDAPGHDPSGGVTLAAAIAALNGQGIQAEAIDVGALNSTGQAAAIAAATGGNYHVGINASTIVDTINDAITAAIANYTEVSIDTSEVPAGLGVSVIPLSYVGAFDRSIARNFEFDVEFTGLSVGDYSFNLYGTVDGGRVATEADRIKVNGGTTVPDAGSSMALFGLALAGVAVLRRKLS